MAAPATGALPAPSISVKFFRTLTSAAARTGSDSRARIPRSRAGHAASAAFFEPSHTPGDAAEAACPAEESNLPGMAGLIPVDHALKHPFGARRIENAAGAEARHVSNRLLRRAATLFH